MTDSVCVPGSDDLHWVNQELAALLNAEPAELATGAEAALEDDLVICGILGGKDVGKSTLINALAKADVSVDTAEVGRGTQRPMAYVHEAAQGALRRRLLSTGRDVPFDVTTHRAEPIRNVVLVDMPDFDSEFLDHLEAVRAVAPLLDRILWVLTPRKIGDRAWVRMLHDVVKDPRNVHCVLNKVDELLADSDPFVADSAPRTGDDRRRAEIFWRKQHEWVRRAIASGDCSQGDGQRFLVAAAFPDAASFTDRIGLLWNDTAWQVYAADRATVAEVARLASEELNRLRSSVLCPVPANESSAIKEANRDHQQRANVERIKRHYDLGRTIAQLAQMCDPRYLQQVLNDAMGQECYATMGATIRARLRSDTELADELLERRVEHWPLLRLVYWPFGWLSRTVARRAMGKPPAARAEPSNTIADQRRVLVERIDLLRSRILAEHSALVRRLNVESELPTAETLADHATSALRQIPERSEARLLEHLREHDRRPSIFARAALWFVFLWFPFLQPVLTGVLEMFSDTGTFEVARGAYRIVSALSAPHLLAGFAVVAGFYVAVLAAMYARRLRALRCVRDEHARIPPIQEAVDEVLVSEVVAPLIRPFHDILDRLTCLLDRLDGGSCKLT